MPPVLIRPRHSLQVTDVAPCAPDFGFTGDAKPVDARRRSGCGHPGPHASARCRCSSSRIALWTALPLNSDIRDAAGLFIGLPRAAGGRKRRSRSKGKSRHDRNLVQGGGAGPRDPARRQPWRQIGAGDGRRAGDGARDRHPVPDPGDPPDDLSRRRQGRGGRRRPAFGSGVQKRSASRLPVLDLGRHPVKRVLQPALDPPRRARPQRPHRRGAARPSFRADGQARGVRRRVPALCRRLQRARRPHRRRCGGDAAVRRSRRSRAEDLFGARGRPRGDGAPPRSTQFHVRPRARC